MSPTSCQTAPPRNCSCFYLFVSRVATATFGPYRCRGARRAARLLHPAIVPVSISLYPGSQPRPSDLIDAGEPDELPDCSTPQLFLFLSLCIPGRNRDLRTLSMPGSPTSCQTAPPRNCSCFYLFVSRVATATFGPYRCRGARRAVTPHQSRRILQSGYRFFKTNQTIDSPGHSLLMN